MKRIGNLWSEITSFENLFFAWKKAKQGKADRPGVASFALNVERNLFVLQHQLKSQTYQPSGYRMFTIYDRKPRNIAAAPFFDRVVHHALLRPLEPLLDNRLISDCYACRKGKGVHAAVNRYQRWAQKQPYVLKMDIMGYFPNIDHLIMKTKLQRLIKDPSILWLFDQIIDSSPVSQVQAQIFAGDDLVEIMQRRRGLPIGNLTSQLLGNLYLNDLDHFIQQTLGCSQYLRYVDDLIIVGKNKQQLWDYNIAINEFLTNERLRLHPNKTHLSRVTEGVDVLGYKVYPNQIRLRRDNGYRYRRHLRKLARAYQRREINLQQVKSSVAAWLGHAKHAQSQSLCEKILSSVSFTRGAVQNEGPSCSSGRRLEQQTGEHSFCQPQQEQH